jgi:ABC-2 type transport system ATP-binding protein
MASERDVLESMTGDELVRLARALKIPLTNRLLKRSWLLETIRQRLEKTESTKTETKLHWPAVKFSGVEKRFGKKVGLRKLDLSVRPGEIVGLVGPNGAGKTTTLRILTGIISSSKGEVTIDGFDIRKKPLQAKQRIGYIPERPTCYASLRVREYLTFVARIYGVPKPTFLIRLKEYVDLLELGPLLGSFIGTLSKGNLQRTLLAGIFIREPPYILALDEPIYGLDPRGAWVLKKVLKKLRNDGSCAILSTHTLEVAQGLCDRFVIMNEGEVVGEGTLEGLLQQHKNASTLEEVFLELTGGMPMEQGV